MKFYKFRQNNSGGGFITNENLGISVYIEAKDAEYANFEATRIGIYFDGCDSGDDCHCCGDRWSRAAEYDSVESPDIEQKIQEELNGFGVPWGDPYIVVHYQDGIKKSYTHPKWEGEK